MREDNRLNIMIGGDVVPTDNSKKAFSSGDVSELLDGSLIKLLREADIRIFNLETPMTNKNCPISKCGPNLRAEPETVKGLKALDPTVVTLANNHIMDHGAVGLYDTLKIMNQSGMEYLGVGDSINDMKHSYIIEKLGYKIGIYACVEHEFSVAENEKAGANPFIEKSNNSHIAKLKQKTDFVIVLYHGGKEHYRYPSPNLRKYCRAFIDAGANVVICQHSHCIGCEEKYNGGNILYGQGNFLFEKNNNEFWNTSLLVKIMLGKGTFEVEYIPICRNTPGARIADETESATILKEFHQRSEEIKEPGFVEKNFKEYSLNNLDVLLMRFSIVQNGFVFKVINKLSGNRFRKWYFRKVMEKQSKCIQNMIECESWNEMLRACTKNF